MTIITIIFKLLLFIKSFFVQNNQILENIKEKIKNIEM